MRRSSQSRLTPKQQSHFPGDTLFDKIARTVCRAGVLPAKELFEAWEVARRVRRKYRGGRVVDLAGGHGPLAVDVVRARHLAASGYTVMTRTIPADITSRNRLLMGHPREMMP